jgi:hypothetical protein
MIYFLVVAAQTDKNRLGKPSKTSIGKWKTMVDIYRKKKPTTGWLYWNEFQEHPVDREAYLKTSGITDFAE